MAAKLTGQDALLRRLRAIGEPRPLLRALQLETVREAKLLVPRKTGNLGRSIVPGSISGKTATVEANANYAPFVEFKTRPHRITAKPGKVLAWPAKGAKVRLSGRLRASEYNRATGKAKKGRLIFARSVNHPGTKAQPFLLPGARKALDTAGIGTIVDAWNGAA